MNEVTLHFDNMALKSIQDLMKYYKIKSKAELIAKAISLLKIVAYIDNTQGELVARKGEDETRIFI